MNVDTLSFATLALKTTVLFIHDAPRACLHCIPPALGVEAGLSGVTASISLLKSSQANLRSR